MTKGVTAPYLIPQVKSLRLTGGVCTVAVATAIDAADGHYAIERSVLTDALSANGMAVVTEPSCMAIVLSRQSRGRHADAYTLTISGAEVRISGEGESGLFYGVQTFVQIIRQCGLSLPCLEIDDFPDFDCRGFYHDVTRGKIPSLDTLKMLADKLASYKINQLQLYVEHAFCFSAVPEFRENFDTLTADVIREFDRYCRERHIDLVPSMATFGHLYELLRIPRLEHLNELPLHASEIARDLWDRMAHYTIDPCNAESFELVSAMLKEYCGLFSSRFVNICCDETFDLGTGKNRAVAEKNGAGRLYVDFVKKIAGVVLQCGNVPMMWGDIVLDHPDLISELSPQTIFLNWNYKTDCTDDASRKFCEAGVTQYVCPGVTGWSRFTNDIASASSNIRRQVRFGKQYRAAGVLNTDWGDCGHVNFMAASFHGMALGAALSWNADSWPDDGEFDEMLSRQEWGEQCGKVYGLLRELGSICSYHFGNIYAWVNAKECLWNREREIAGWDSASLLQRFERASQIYEDLKTVLSHSTGKSPGPDELLWGARAVRWTLALLGAKLTYEYGACRGPALRPAQLATEAQALREQFITLWRLRNLESELRNVTDVFDRVIAAIMSWKSN